MATITFSGTLTFLSSSSSSSATSCFSKSRVKSPNCVFIKPSNVSAPNISSLSLSRRRISHHEGVVLCSKSRTFPKVISSCMGTDTSDSPKEATIDLKFPRRSLSVQFTCNQCSESTKRLVNRVAFERGTIFVQCAGCLKHHKLVDNLGLIVEYDFRKEEDMDLGSNQD
ncbi:hypothetical protein C5167_022872 [Papaver somniferum]|uniref:DNL-type domain-containing protein n=1 Tax=Papaver somniferum TaxID=3469 RepID=A0A4Y7JM65_PAPSO|nr:uncharacterized protein LOC113277543 [Papaver somniferum]RZC61120.1 hypothetical protein C5167_022872 [Papaver somniferum]